MPRRQTIYTVESCYKKGIRGRASRRQQCCHPLPIDPLNAHQAFLPAPLSSLSSSSYPSSCSSSSAPPHHRLLPLLLSFLFSSSSLVLHRLPLHHRSRTLPFVVGGQLKAAAQPLHSGAITAFRFQPCRLQTFLNLFEWDACPLGQARAQTHGDAATPTPNQRDERCFLSQSTY